MIVEKPFNLDIDVTPQTPLNEIPESYLKPAGARIHAAAQDDKNLKIALEELSINPDIENYLLNEIHRTVTYHDDHVVNVAFHSALSAYSKPLNLALKAESGSGKTYSTTQTVLFMPQEDVLYIASQSPKVISHEKGIRKAADGRNFDDIPEPQKTLQRRLQHKQRIPKRIRKLPRATQSLPPTARRILLRSGPEKQNHPVPRRRYW